MANWDKLNSEMDSALESMTSEDWSLWLLNRESKKRMRQYELIMKRKIKEESILLSNIKGSQSQFENICTQKGSNILDSNDLTDNSSYALAA
jgi:hypothetical protein